MEFDFTAKQRRGFALLCLFTLHERHENTLERRSFSDIQERCKHIQAWNSTSERSNRAVLHYSVCLPVDHENKLKRRTFSMESVADCRGKSEVAIKF